MLKNEIDNLRYRRQYLLIPNKIDCPFNHFNLELECGYLLYYHPDLPVSDYYKEDLRIILLGDMFDSDSPEKNNIEILGDLWENSLSGFLNRTDKYTGRYVLIYQKGENVILATDATATRKIFYSEKDEKLWIGSTSHLLAQVLGSKQSNNKSILEYYNTEDFDRLDFANIGNTTYYDGMKQLMPNHYLEVKSVTIQRFWPNKPIAYKPYKEVAKNCAHIIKGYMTAISNRYDVMLPITAGNDTRLLLAASRHITDKFFYYINKESTLNDNSTDIRIPKSLFKRLGLEFHILDLPEIIDEDFERVYNENNPFATKKYLPHISNYHKNFSHKVNLPGNFASAPWGFNRLKPKNVTPEKLAKLYMFQNYPHAIEYYTEWLEDCWDLCKEYNVNVVRLFYWEERIANWGTQTQLDKDIAQDDINPFNSRLFIREFSSVKDKYNNMPNYLLHRQIIRELWPELLEVPINPSLANRFLQIAKSIGLFKPALILRYHVFRRSPK